MHKKYVDAHISPIFIVLHTSCTYAQSSYSNLHVSSFENNICVAQLCKYIFVRVNAHITTNVCKIYIHVHVKYTQCTFIIHVHVKYIIHVHVNPFIIHLQTQMHIPLHLQDENGDHQMTLI